MISRINGRLGLAAQGGEQMNIDDETRKKIDEYTRRYAIKHEITVEEAKEHFLVKVISQYYRDADKDKVFEIEEDKAHGCECELEDRSC